MKIDCRTFVVTGLAARFRDIGSDAAPLDAAGFDQFIAAEIAKW